MSKISLEKFIENTKGTQVDVPWETKSKLKGQCVSLIQQYILQCLEQPAQARGDAKDWITSYVNEGLGFVADKPRKGDILVFPNDGVINGVSYGHIAICVDENTLYDQNNFRHDNGLCGYGQIFTTDYVVLRPYAELIEETKPVETPVQESIEEQPQVDILDLVRRTIRGDFGNGQARRDALGSNYDEVQRQVNLNLQNGLTQWDNIRLF